MMSRFTLPTLLWPSASHPRTQAPQEAPENWSRSPETATAWLTLGSWARKTRCCWCDLEEGSSPCFECTRSSSLGWVSTGTSNRDIESKAHHKTPRSTSQACAGTSDSAMATRNTPQRRDTGFSHARKNTQRRQTVRKMRGTAQVKSCTHTMVAPFRVIPIVCPQPL